MNPQVYNEEEITLKTPETVNQGEVLISMESMIRSHISAEESLKAEAKKYKDMLKDALEADEVYRAHKKLADDANKVLKETKAQIMQRPQMAELDNKAKSLTQEAKATQLALFDYVAEYVRMSGVNEIETDSGEVLDIVMQAKLVRKSSR